MPKEEILSFEESNQQSNRNDELFDLDIISVLQEDSNVIITDGVDDLFINDLDINDDIFDVLPPVSDQQNKEVTKKNDMEELNEEIKKMKSIFNELKHSDELKERKYNGTETPYSMDAKTWKIYNSLKKSLYCKQKIIRSNTLAHLKNLDKLITETNLPLKKVLILLSAFDFIREVINFLLLCTSSRRINTSPNFICNMFIVHIKKIKLITEKISLTDFNFLIFNCICNLNDILEDEVENIKIELLMLNDGILDFYNKKKDLSRNIAYIARIGMKFEKKENLNKQLSSTYNNQFAERKWVWVVDNEKCFLPGYIVKEEEDKIQVNVNNEIVTINENEVMKMNPPKFDLVDDLGSLCHLNEPSLLHNLITRYQNNLIYTYSGLFLVAVNPYRDLKIYTEKNIKKYALNKKGELEPHIYGVANEAYNNMLNNKENQSILITGESGAGKTENTKKVIEFLSSIAGISDNTKNEIFKTQTNFGIRNRNENNNCMNACLQESTIDKKIIMTNPILEAFGNAKTIKNDNSSRFGKFIQIKFNGGNICGAHIEKYLLEKSRITYQNSNERNYHIFYQLLKCKDEKIKAALFLEENIKNYRFLQGTMDIEGIDDVKEFELLRKSFRDLNISEEVEFFYYKIVASVLNLGNIVIKEENGAPVIQNLQVVENICKLLEIPSSQFINSLLHPVIKAGNEFITQSRSMEQVYSIIDALAKILYDKMFDQIINDLNNKLGTSNSTNFIGVLDIAGFEIFKENGFEQLCINYTNEKLQQFFNHHMFILEQEIYRKEKIEWNFIDFGLDLQPTIDLIEKSNPIGILSYLDEECVMPKASDKTFLNKLKNIKNGKFKNVLFKEGFILEHYAGNVEYLVNNWIIKNKDPNFENINELINKSSNENVSNLSFVDKNIKRGFFRTVGQKHKEQLNSLMNILSKTNPHFVRCIIPNLKKSPNCLENKLILEQLKCNGVLEGIRISRQGYPSRMKYCEFADRYRILKSDIENVLYQDKKEEALNILKDLNLSDLQYKCGTTKLFFRQGVLADIEEIRDIKISEIMKKIQYLARLKLDKYKETLNEHRKKSINLIKKNAKICIDLQKWNWWKLYLKIKPLLDVKMRDNELKSKDKIIEKLNKTVEEFKHKLESLESVNNELNLEKDKLGKELELEKIHISENNELLQGIRNQSKEIEKDNDSLRNKIYILTKEFEDEKKLFLEEKEKDKKIKLDLESQIDDLRNKRLQFANDEVKNLQKLLNIQKEENKQLLTEKHQNRNEIDDLQNLIQEVEATKSALVVDNNRLFSDNRNLKVNLELQINNLKKSKEEKDDLIFENENLEKSLNKLEKELDCKNEMYLRVVEENKNIKSDFNLLKLDNNMNIEKIKGLQEQVLELEKSFSCYEKVEKSNVQSDKIIKKLKDKLEFYINNNNLLRQEIDEIREKNDSLTKARMDEFFVEERKFEQEKKLLKKEIQRLSNENFIIRKELDDFKASSESSDDSTLERLYTILDKEKKIRRDLEQKILEYESKTHNLQNIINELSKCNCSLNDSCVCKCSSCNSSCRLSYKNISNIDYEEIEKIINNVNILVDGFNRTFYKILNDQKDNIYGLKKELVVLKNSLLDKDNIIKDIRDRLYLTDKDYSKLKSEHFEINKKLQSSSSTNDNNLVKINQLETSLVDKENIIEMFKSKYEQLILSVKKIQSELDSESEKSSLNIKKITDLYELKIKEVCDTKDKEIYDLKDKLSLLEQKHLLDYNKKEVLKFDTKNASTIKIEPLVLDYNSNHLIKIQDLERKKIILEKEIKNNQKAYQTHFDKFVEENGELKKVIEELKCEKFTLLKDNNMLKIQNEQMERDIIDNKEMIDFLKNISISLKKKK